MATASGRILIALLDAGVVGVLVLVDVLRRRRTPRAATPMPVVPAPRRAVIDLTAAEARDPAAHRT